MTREPARIVAPPPILTDHHVGGIALITLNDPPRRNALSDAMRLALRDALTLAMDDDGVRVIVLTGAGGAFCAGGDIATMQGLSADGARSRLRRAHDALRVLVAGGKPVIAAVEGSAAGAGLGLAAACDLVMASETARFITGFEKLGLMPDLAALWSLPARMGLPAARRMLYFGATVDGAEAQRLGLADATAPEGQALARALDWAGELARHSPGALRAMKLTLAGQSQDLSQVLASEERFQGELMSSQDLSEGLSALRAGRAPRFQGR